ncbi:MAG: M20/M25/M40 family metallo-hydrolase [Rhodothermales bacterium]
MRYSFLLLVLLLVGCGTPSPVGAQDYDQRFDAIQLLEDVKLLSADAWTGRRAGTEGNAQARTFLLERYAALGLTPFGEGYAMPFSFTPRGGGDEVDGINLIGYVEGTATPDTFIVVTAHFDHLGERNGQIYNGADDNASGTAALLAMASYFVAHPPAHSIVFAALDAEEMGLQGARHFVANPPMVQAQIALNINMDMVSRSTKNELYAVGTYYAPYLKPYLEAVGESALLDLLFGHDSPEWTGSDNWTMASDHGPFHVEGIPFIYFGVEDHPGYHQPNDVYAEITPGFYINAVDVMLSAIQAFDANLSDIQAARRAMPKE